MQISRKECEIEEEAIYKAEKILGQLRGNEMERMEHENASTRSKKHDEKCESPYRTPESLKRQLCHVLAPSLGNRRRKRGSRS
jgi:fructose/tagatose bisphosphate aldolase